MKRHLRNLTLLSLGSLSVTGAYGCSAGANDEGMSTESAVSTVVGKVHVLPLDTGTCAPTTVNLAPATSPLVMHNPRVHLIYWLPSGRHFVGLGDATSDAKYQSLLQSFVSDLGSMGIFTMLSRYTDGTSAPVSASLAGTYVYTKAYPNGRGTTSNPLLDTDIHNAIDDVLSGDAGLGWKATTEDAYLVFTGANVQSCVASDKSQCTFNATLADGGANQTYGAYHASYTSVAGTVVYANMPAAASIGYFTTPSKYPNGYSYDATIQAVSHELIEMFTNPTGKGWEGPNAGCDEIGDKCNQDVGSVINADGSNIRTSSGHSYLVQREWSNALGGCTLNTPPSCTETSACPATYGPPELTIQCSPTVDFYLVDSYTHATSFLQTGSSQFRVSDTYPDNVVYACPHRERLSSTSCATFSTYRPKIQWCGQYVSPMCPTGEHWCGPVEKCQRFCT